MPVSSKLFFFSVPKINWSISFWSEKHSSTNFNLLNGSEIYYFHPVLLFTQTTEWAVGIVVLSVPVPNNFLWVLSFVMDCLLQLHQINWHSLFFKNKAALMGHRILQPLKTMQLSHPTLLNWSKSSFSFPNNSFWQFHNSTQKFLSCFHRQNFIYLFIYFTLKRKHFKIIVFGYSDLTSFVIYNLSEQNLSERAHTKLASHFKKSISILWQLCRWSPKAFDWK